LKGGLISSWIVVVMFVEKVVFASFRRKAMDQIPLRVCSGVPGRSPM
jgi:hypothetical protein